MTGQIGETTVSAGLGSDPQTAQLTIATGLIPHIIDGVPLQIKDLNITIDRAGFIFSPTNCNKMAITSNVFSGAAAEPGLSNSELAGRVGIADARQISRDLARAARQGLIRNTRDAAGSASTNAWRPTASGEEFLAAVTREAAAAASMAVEVPEEFGGRMDHRLVDVVRVIADQPWLYTSEIAVRAGVDPAEISTVIAYLLKLAVVAGVRDVRFKGTPKAWLPTASGEGLDRAIGRETPRPPRSVALDLMWQSGGRLSVDVVAVLRSSAPNLR